MILNLFVSGNIFMLHKIDINPYSTVHKKVVLTERGMKEYCFLHENSFILYSNGSLYGRDLLRKKLWLFISKEAVLDISFFSKSKLKDLLMLYFGHPTSRWRRPPEKMYSSPPLCQSASFGKWAAWIYGPIFPIEWSFSSNVLCVWKNDHVSPHYIVCYNDKNWANIKAL